MTVAALHGRRMSRVRRFAPCSAAAIGFGLSAITIPNCPAISGGRVVQMLSIGSLIFRHEPSAKSYDGEIAGHLHPLARVARRGRGVSRRCFAGDGKRLVMPAFGAYAGGLNIRDRAIVALFGALSFTAHLLGDGRLYAIPAARCLSD